MTSPYEFALEDSPYKLAAQMTDGRSWSVTQRAGEKRLLEMVAYRRAPEMLDAVCRFVEEICGECRCGIYLIDWHDARIRAWVAPSLPVSFNAAICELPLNDDTAPFARAARLKTEVIVADLESDPLWRDSPFRSLAIAHGLRACWSTPIYSLSGYVLGTLAILQDQPAHPTPLQQELIASVAHVASIAIEREQAEAALDKAENDLAQMAGIMGVGVSLAGDLVQPLSGIVINASTCLKMLSAVSPNVEGARETMRRTLRDCSRTSEMIARLRDLLGGSGARSARPSASGAPSAWRPAPGKAG